MIRYDALATARALPFDALIAALRTRFAQGATVPARHVHLPNFTPAFTPATGVEAEPAALTSLIMPAWCADGLRRWYGVKIINIAPGNRRLGLPGLHASYLLHDADTGIPVALIDGDVLTARRTAAASALAASWLARADAQHLLVLGTGRVASLLPVAYRAVRPVRRVSIWSRSSAPAQQLVGRLQAEGFEADVVDDLPAALRTADMVSSATLATAPLILGQHLAAGSHLDLIGSFTPAMREADDDCLRGAAVYVDTLEALEKSGDLLGPMSRGVLTASDIRGTLAALASGAACGRTMPHERTVFKSVGTALEDLAAAILVVQSAP